MPDEASLNEFVRQVLHGRNDSVSELRIDNRRICRFREGIFLLPLFSKHWSNEILTLCPNKTIHIQGVGAVRLQISVDKAENSTAGLRATLCWRGSHLIANSKKMRRKLKKMLNASGIPPWWRDRIPIVLIGDESIFIGKIHSSKNKSVSAFNACLEWSLPDDI